MRKDRVKSVEWSFPSSPNASSFGFPKTGCWTVEVGEVGKPTVAVAAFEKKDDAIADAQARPHPWSATFLHHNPEFKE